MDDKKIEELIRESWTPEPSKGMQERILRKAAEASEGKSSPASVIWRYLQPAFIGASVLFVAMSLHFESARQERIIQALQPDTETHNTIRIASWEEYNRATEQIIAQIQDEFRQTN